MIVIAGSTGGLNALCRVVQRLPADFPGSIIAVLHTGESSPRLLATIVGKSTSLAVLYAETGERPLRGHIYIAPPGRHLIFSAKGCLGLRDGPKVRHCRPAADLLFQSAAEFHGSDVIGLILSGGDGDGANGLTAIKTKGGITIVQHPGDVLDPGMPSARLPATVLTLPPPSTTLGH
jgi:two-component system chemotaxis response regulator CheB